MNQKITPLLIATGLAILNFGTSLQAAPLTTPGASGANRAFLDAPRTIEQYPALARVSAIGREPSPNPARGLNRALAASPRGREEFPELVRVQPARVPGGELAGAPRNRALLAAPRTLEQFPALQSPARKSPGIDINGGTPGSAGALP